MLKGLDISPHSRRACYLRPFTVLGPFRDRFGVVLGSFWGRFGTVLGSSWDRRGTILGSFWDANGMIDAAGAGCRTLGPAHGLGP